MISNRNSDASITLQNLQPGDILSWVILGTRHFAIYSPVDGEQADIVHMFYNARNECAVFKNTISQQLKNLKAGMDITVVRSRTTDEGQAIADQAEFWLHQGINYDFNRLGKVLYNINHDVPATPVEENILQYLKYAARRNTMPVKSQEFPILIMNWKTKAGLFLVGSKYSCDPAPLIGLKLLDYSTASPTRSKGLNCIGFIAAVIAAVKLKNVIGTVTKETGWRSLKDFESIASLMTEDQSQQFTTEKLAEILTPAIAHTHPHSTHSEVFLENLLDDEAHWQCMGTLDKNSELKPFDKAAYDAEQLNHRTTIRENHARFIADFSMGIFAKKTEKQSNNDVAVARVTLTRICPDEIEKHFIRAS